MTRLAECWKTARSDGRPVGGLRHPVARSARSTGGARAAAVVVLGDEDGLSAAAPLGPGRDERQSGSRGRPRSRRCAVARPRHVHRRIHARSFPAGSSVHRAPTVVRPMLGVSAAPLPNLEGIDAVRTVRRPPESAARAGDRDRSAVSRRSCGEAAPSRAWSRIRDGPKGPACALRPSTAIAGLSGRNRAAHRPRNGDWRRRDRRFAARADRGEMLLNGCLRSATNDNDHATDLQVQQLIIEWWLLLKTRNPHGQMQ